jgi:translocation and assembly module TamA
MGSVVIVMPVRRPGTEQDDREHDNGNDRYRDTYRVVSEHAEGPQESTGMARSVPAGAAPCHLARGAGPVLGKGVMHRLIQAIAIAMAVVSGVLLTVLPAGLTREAHAQDAPDVPDTPASGAAETYRVEIDAPLTLGRLLREDLDLLRWRTYAGMNRDLLERLVAEGQAQLTEALATEGYFSPTILRTITGDARPWTVRFEIDPGPPTRVADVQVEIVGSISADPARMHLQRERILARWPLPAGTRFRQADWDLGKRQATEVLARDRFAGARITRSQATIDPDRLEARLEVELDSGPPFRFGEIQIRGLSRYPESLVRNLATFSAGDPFEDADLLQFQRRLTATGHFSAVQVEMDDDPANAAAAPVRVSVIEGNSRRIEVGVGYSTDTLYRAQFGYTDNDFLERGWRWRSDARVESRSARATSSITAPAGSDGWQYAHLLQFNQSDISGLFQREGSFTVNRTAVDERHQPQWSLGAHVQQQQPEGSPSETVHALFGAYRYTRRATDDLLSPMRGTMWSVQVGAAPPGVSTRTFARGVAQVAHWIPFGRNLTLMVRAEAGAIASTETDGIPESFLFRVGGDTSIRGYPYQSIGVTKGAAVTGGRLYALGSVEATRWVDERWGVALFYDAGNAVDRVTDMGPVAQGAGLGLRVRTPLGPVRVDIAYGELSKQVRLHLSLGVYF